jgi:hypothetical protein
MRRVADLGISPGERGRRATFAATFLFLGLMSVGTIGFGLIVASWGGLHVEALLLLLAGVVMTAISASGWSSNRSGRTPWGLLAAWPITLAVLMGLLAVVQ